MCENVAHVNGILFVHKEKWSTKFCRKMDASGKYFIKLSNRLQKTKTAFNLSYGNIPWGRRMWSGISNFSSIIKCFNGSRILEF